LANVLLVDDDAGFLAATSDLLGLLGHSVSTAASVEAARQAVEDKEFDRVFLDLMLPDGSGLQVLDSLASDHKKQTKVTIITGHPSVKNLVKSLYGPRVNYLIKPISLDQLRVLLDDKSGVAEVAQDVSGVHKHLGFLIGESQVMKNLYSMITRVSKTSANVMLLGESGVGKEVVANAIHHASLANGEFVATNCGAFSRELITSELFGHEKGAFTGAVARKSGVFEQAENGTLFLDEITEMPIDLQPNLLRVLETNKFTSLGATKSVDINCRVISATNRSELQLMSEGCLREDLYFRLAVFPITVPSLRERREDIPLMAKHFLGELNDEHGTTFNIVDEEIEKLKGYDWPGNVRELRHTIHRAFIMTDTESPSLIFTKLGSPFKNNVQQKGVLRAGRTIEDVERELIEVTLDQYDGDKKMAASILGISLKTLYNRINDYEEK